VFFCTQSRACFLPETFASNSGVLAQKCCEQDPKISGSVLNVFLKIDQNAESEHQENTLRGIRRSQVKLATYYLKSGYKQLAQVVFNDM
jgi:hypothetical protein